MLADYPFLDVVWSMLVFFLWVAWFWLLFSIWGDLFRRRDLSGWGKAGWLIFTLVVPFLGVFVYVVTQNDGMTQRNLERAKAQREQMDEYVRTTAGGGVAVGWRRSSARSSCSTAARSTRPSSRSSSSGRWPAGLSVANAAAQVRPATMSHSSRTVEREMRRAAGETPGAW